MQYLFSRISHHVRLCQAKRVYYLAMFIRIILMFLFFSAVTNSQADDTEYEHAVIINQSKCSDTLILHEGNGWILVKADFDIDSAKCWSEQYAKHADDFTWHKGISKVSFPQYKTMVIYLEGVDQAFGGLWHCMFLSLSRNASQPVSCSIKVVVRARPSQSSDVPTMQYAPYSKRNTGNWMWIGITIGITVIFIIILVVVILYYKRKVYRYGHHTEISNEILRSDRPSLSVSREPVAKFENIPIPDNASVTSDNIYEGVYNRNSVLKEKPPIPQRGTRVITIKRPY